MEKLPSFCATRRRLLIISNNYECTCDAVLFAVICNIGSCSHKNVNIIFRYPYLRYVFTNSIKAVIAVIICYPRIMQ
jgi:hypothetical protein